MEWNGDEMVTRGSSKKKHQKSMESSSYSARASSGDQGQSPCCTKVRGLEDSLWKEILKARDWFLSAQAWDFSRSRCNEFGISSMGIYP